MASKKKNPASVLSDADAQHKQRLEAYAKQVDKLYKSAVKEISQLAAKVGAIPPSNQFSFAHNPGISEDVDKVIQKLSSKIQALIEMGDQEQWMAACKKSNAFIASIMNTSAIPKDVLKTYQDRNLEALSAFQERKINGMNLSERVWKHVSPLKQEVETIVDTTARYSQNGINAPQNLQKIDEAIGTGISADELSREVRSCLKEPNKLFRRIRDKYGNLHLSQNAKLYHPGQGVYRSSYKNAKRMTRSEINMAYRQSDYLRWQQLDFVVGMHIGLSQNHTCLGQDGKPHPFFDICDELAGKYPKDFKFCGWHPQCRCIATPILKPFEEWQEDREHIDEKAYRQLPAENEVSTTPAAFRTYMQENHERIAGWKNTPYYIKDNPHYVANAIDPSKYPANKLALSEDVRQQLTEYRTYAYTHQGSEKFGKAIDAALMAQMTGDQKAFDDAMDLMAFTKKTNERIQAYTAKKKAEKAKAKLQDPAELRHKYDAQIDVLRQNAAKYKLDMTGIDEAYTSLNMAKIEAAIKEQQDILDFKVAKMEKIYAAAEKRHAARTPEKEKALKDFAAQHKEKTEKAYKEFDDIIKEASGITEADVSTLRNLKTGKAGTTPTKAGEKVNATLERMQEEAQKLKKITEEYNSAMNEAKALVSELKGIKDVDTDSVLKATSIKKAKEGVKALHDVKDKIAKLTNLDDPLQVAKDYSLAAAVKTHNAVAKTLKDWKNKYKYNSLEDNLEHSKAKLESEMTYMKTHASKYDTWEVAYKAYEKKLKEVNKLIYQKEMEAVKVQYLAFQKKTLSSKDFNAALKELKTAVVANDLSMAQAAIKKIEAVEASQKKIHDELSKLEDILKQHPKASKFKKSLQEAKDAFATGDLDTVSEKIKEAQGNIPKSKTKINKTKQTEELTREDVSDAGGEVEFLKKTCNVDEATAKDYYDAVNGFSYGWDYEIREYQMGRGASIDLNYNKHTLEAIKKKAEDIEKYIDASPKWHGSETYRGMSVSTEQIERWKQCVQDDTKVDMQGTASWSTNISTSEYFAGRNIGKTRNGEMLTEKALFICKHPQYGTSIRPLSEFYSEHEILCSKDCRWKITAYKEENGYHVFEVEPIPVTRK